MQLANEHVKTARNLFQPCVEAFEQSFEQDFRNTNKVIDLSEEPDSEIIERYLWLAAYENNLADD